MRSSTSLRLGLLALLLLGLALRLYRLDAQSLWYDEGVTANLAQRTLSDLTQWTANDIQPPLYYYLIAGWGRLAGWSEWSLRFPSAAFGLLLLPLMAGLVRLCTIYGTPRLLVVLLTALHPLLVYYSQEARMYTLLTLLGGLAAYCLLRSMEEARPGRWLGGYVLMATAAVYTHYFAFFLLLALAIGYLYYQLERTRYLLQATWRLLQPFALANLLVLLGYIPWLGALWTRFRVDSSYWQGDFKLLEGLRSIALSFTSGETIQQRPATWLLLPFAVVTIVAILAMRSRSQSVPNSTALAKPANSPDLAYALLWIVIPILGVLTLAAFAPKFNARYAMIALPGLLLLWSIGLASWLSNSFAPKAAQAVAPDMARRRWVAGLSLLFMICSWLYADWNWYFDRAFTKDQWREVAAFLRARLQPQETIVLVSGHAWPVWRYYAPDLPLVRLPELDVLDVNAILDYANTALGLRSAFAANTGKTGAWLVEWQEEVVDPTGVVPTQLELGGREKGQSATFWGLTLRRFSRIKPERIAEQPPIDHPLTLHFGNQLILRGYHLMENGDLLLFWQRDPATLNSQPEYQITGQTHTATGAFVARVPDQRPANYNYPVSRWRAGEIVTGHLPATQWLGETPQIGTYTLQLSVYVIVNGKPQPLLTSNGQTFSELTITITTFD